MSILSRGLKPILEMKILMICEKYDFFSKMTRIVCSNISIMVVHKLCNALHGGNGGTTKTL